MACCKSILRSSQTFANGFKPEDGVMYTGFSTTTPHVNPWPHRRSNSNPVTGPGYSGRMDIDVVMGYDGRYMPKPIAENDGGVPVTVVKERVCGGDGCHGGGGLSMCVPGSAARAPWGAIVRQGGRARCQRGKRVIGQWPGSISLGFVSGRAKGLMKGKRIANSKIRSKASVCALFCSII